MDKTAVDIDAPDGTSKVFTGDTAIVFTVSDIEDFLNKKVPQIHADTAYIGEGIPEALFTDVIASLVSSFIENRQKASPAAAALSIHEVGAALLARSQRILDACSREQLEAELTKIKNSLANIKRMATQKGSGSDEKLPKKEGDLNDSTDK